LRAAADNLLPFFASSGGPSKVPFYVAGSVLAAWAVALALLGMARPGFPSSAGASRGVMALSALLVVATMGAAIGTASKHKGEAHAGERSTPAPAPPTPAQAPAPSGGGGATVKISADPSGQLKFQQSSVTAKPGKVKIEFDNPSPVPHDVTVARGATKLGGTKVVASGKASAELALQPGSYTFYCSVDGHRQAGMQGTLSVAP
jgi:plastocyanin